MLERINKEMAGILAQFGIGNIFEQDAIAQILSIEVYKGYTLKDLIERGVIPVEQSLPECNIVEFIDFDKHIFKYGNKPLQKYCPVLKANFIKVDPREEGE